MRTIEKVWVAIAASFSAYTIAGIWWHYATGRAPWPFGNLHSDPVTLVQAIGWTAYIVLMGVWVALLEYRRAKRGRG
jgi:hypothetical protein